MIQDGNRRATWVEKKLMIVVFTIILLSLMSFIILYVGELDDKKIINQNFQKYIMTKNWTHIQEQREFFEKNHEINKPNKEITKEIPEVVSEINEMVEKENIELISIDENNSENPRIISQQFMPMALKASNDIKCWPSTFGYTEEQANSIYDPNKMYPRCPESDSFIRINENK